MVEDCVDAAATAAMRAGVERKRIKQQDFCFIKKRIYPGRFYFCCSAGLLMMLMLMLLLMLLLMLMLMCGTGGATCRHRDADFCCACGA